MRSLFLVVVVVVVVVLLMEFSCTIVLTCAAQMLPAAEAIVPLHCQRQRDTFDNLRIGTVPAQEDEARQEQAIVPVTSETERQL